MAHPRTDIPNPNFFPYEAIPFENLDWTWPISKLLQSGTATLHQSASHTAADLSNGRLDRDEYVRFLMMMWHVYDALETALDQHPSHPTLAPIYKPTVLSRATPIASDLCYYLSTSNFRTHPAYRAFLSSFPPSLTRYTLRIRTLATSQTPELLLAHAYVRYMADLSGGQFIRRKVMKAYSLPDSGEGVAAFDFSRLEGDNVGTEEGERAGMGEVKRIKEWFREGMIKATEGNERLKQEIVKEANVAYELNTALLVGLEKPKSTSSEEEDYHPDLKEVRVIPKEQAKRSRSALAINTALILIAVVTLAHMLSSYLPGLMEKHWGGLLEIIGA